MNEQYRDQWLETFIKEAGFNHGWEHLEGWARRMAEHAFDRAHPKVKPRPELLSLAMDSGATLMGKPDGSEPIAVYFSIQAWRAFDCALRPVPAAVRTGPGTIRELLPMDDDTVLYGGLTDLGQLFSRKELELAANALLYKATMEAGQTQAPDLCDVDDYPEFDLCVKLRSLVASMKEAAR